MGGEDGVNDSGTTKFFLPLCGLLSRMEQETTGSLYGEEEICSEKM